MPVDQDPVEQQLPGQSVDGERRAADDQAHLLAARLLDHLRPAPPQWPGEQRIEQSHTGVDSGTDRSAVLGSLRPLVGLVPAVGRQLEAALDRRSIPDGDAREVVGLPGTGRLQDDRNLNRLVRSTIGGDPFLQCHARLPPGDLVRQFVRTGSRCGVTHIVTSGNHPVHQIGQPVRPYTLAAALAVRDKSAAEPGEDPTVLPYAHFSVVVNRGCQLVYYMAGECRRKSDRRHSALD